MPSGFAAARMKSKFLVHRYDRQLARPVSQDSEGPWGETVPQYGDDPGPNGSWQSGAKALGLPCLFVDREQNVTTAEGQLVERIATVYVAGDDEIDAGDQLMNIRLVNPDGTDGQVLFDGPIDAHYVSGIAPNGPNVYKQVFIHVPFAEP